MFGTNGVTPAAANLATYAKFNLGKVVVNPSTRELKGPHGNIVVQPRVMHLLLILCDAQGCVVTRDVLAKKCWEGRFVAEDSLNAAIAELRKALRNVSPHELSIETVPKTGYRLVAPQFDEPLECNLIGANNPAADNSSIPLARRLVLGFGVVAIAGLGISRWDSEKKGSRPAILLIDQGVQSIRQGMPDANAQAIQFLTKATELEPNNAKAWGILALAWKAAADFSGPDQTSQNRLSSEIAAKRALAIDPRQSDALLALATLTPSFGDWVATERRIRNVLKIDPENAFAVAALGTLLMSTGQVKACMERLNWMNERDPLSPNLQFRRVYTLWSLNQHSDMDRTADRALQSWPRHPAVWFARFWTLAFTDRVRAAHSLLEDIAIRPPMSPSSVNLIQQSLKAIESQRKEDVRRAVAANLEAAASGPGPAVSAILVLSHLGASEAAYEVASGFLARTGKLVVQLRHTPAQPAVTDQHNRMTMMLWVPASKALRLHADFRPLCERIGLMEYWESTGSRPDFTLGRETSI